MANNRWSAVNVEDPSQAAMDVKAWKYEFNHPDEREEFIEKWRISSEFEMRNRGLMHFYGDDLIAYKQKYPSNQQVNEFLRILAVFFTDELEDDCPSSWKECHPPIWEELIYAAFPHNMTVTHTKNETKNFLTHLMKFVRWIDQREGCNLSVVVERFVHESTSELVYCEELLHKLYLNKFPYFLKKDFDPFVELERFYANAQKYDEDHNSIFEVIRQTDHLLTVKDINTNQMYQIVDFPVKKVQKGILLDGVIAKLSGDLFWTWELTSGVFPHKANEYFVFVD